jgi:hypothetical protein
VRFRTAAFGLVGVCGVLYRTLLKGPVLTWGATGAEAVARLPGDELLEDADGIATRAITIEAPASAVWPWLAQMGPSPRGGSYSYNRIENLLGLNMHSADHVLSQFQHPQIGDTIGQGKCRMRIERIEPQHVLASRSEDGNWVWTFVLQEHDGQTRLISRNRFRLPTLAARLGMLPMEPGSLVMERKMLHGIKQRAERLASPGPRRSGWGERLRWGTTDEEVHSALPGDDLIPDADVTVTRAITIRGRPDAVWPWIAQLGQARGGFYSYDWLENLARCGIHTADRIVPEWQPVQVGDEVRIAPEVPLSVAEVDAGRALVLQGGVPIGGSSPFDFSWAFALHGRSDGTTRLLVRERYGYRRWWARFIVAPTELVSFVMSRKMPLGIRERAERPSRVLFGYATVK